MRVYEKVRAYIDENGLKQVSVAQKAGIPKATFNAILNGKRTLYADDLKAICLALNVSPELFIDVPAACVKKSYMNFGIGGRFMTQDKLYKVASAVNQMDRHLRTELLIHNGAVQQKKLWENTFIKHQIDKRNCGFDFALCDHIRAMVYAMLSSGIRWNRVESEIDAETGSISSIDSVFHQYDAEYILQANPNLLRDEVKRLHCASQYTLNQMKALVCVNIGKLQKWEQRYGSIDAYYQQFIGENGALYALVKQLADPMSKDKLAQMGEALIAEYLKNVGYSIAKPDRHIRRILGHSALDCSDREIVPIYDAMAIIDEISKEAGKSAAEVDYILWMYCADGFGEICTKMKPKCGLCKANNVCTKGGAY